MTFSELFFEFAIEIEIEWRGWTFWRNLMFSDLPHCGESRISTRHGSALSVTYKNVIKQPIIT